MEQLSVVLGVNVPCSRTKPGTSASLSRAQRTDHKVTTDMHHLEFGLMICVIDESS